MKTMERYLYVLFSVLPFVLLCIMLMKYTTNIPFWDDWVLVPLLEKMYNGTLGFQDLWAQHNEHRLFFPRIIMLVIAQLTNWNIYFELAINVLLGVLIYFVVLKSILGTKEITKPRGICALASFIIFSLMQWENWMWGWQIQVFLNVLAVYVSLYAFRLHHWRGYLISVIFGIIATYSFANGILVWPIMLLFLALSPSISKPEKIKRTLFFFAVFLLNVILYYHGYHKPEHHPSLLYGFQHPWEFIKYFFAYLGSPVAGFEGKISFLCGALSFAVFSVIAFHILSKKNNRTTDLLYWFSTALYPILSAAISALGRVGFGYEQALASRYTTFSNMYWIALIMLIVIHTDSIRNSIRLPFGLKFNSTFKVSFLTALIVVFVVHSNVSYQKWIQRYHFISPLEIELLSCNESNYTRIFPNIDSLKSFIVTLSNYKLSIFSFKERIVHETSIPASGSIDSTSGNLSETSLTADGCLKLTGWVVDAENNVPVKRVVAAVNNEIIMYSMVNIERPDVASHFNNANLLKSGWAMEIKGQYLPFGDINLDLYGVRENGEYFKFGTIGIQVKEPRDISSIEVIEYVDNPDQVLGFFDWAKYDGTYLSGGGWAISPLTGNPANEVIITDSKHRILAHSFVTLERPDVAKHFNDENKRKSGWSFNTKIPGLASGEKIFAYVYEPIEKKAYKLKNEHVLGSD